MTINAYVYKSQVICNSGSWQNVTPVFKKYNPSKVNNYRPISLISVLGKVMERCIYKQFYNFLLKNSIIPPHQSRFPPGDSAINQLLSLTNEFDILPASTVTYQLGLFSLILLLSYYLAPVFLWLAKGDIDWGANRYCICRHSYDN
jgi:hypothetical protein